MRIEALNKDLLFYNMNDVFNVIPEVTIQRLKIRLDILFRRQTDLQKVNEDLSQDSLNNRFITSAAVAARAFNETEWLLEAIKIRSVNLLKSFQYLSESSIRSNKYCAMFGSDATVENLLWSQDRILNSCQEPIRDKVRESIVEMSTLKMGGPIILKIMLDIIMDVDDSVLQALIETLRNVRMKDIKGDNVGTIASYLKGAFLLLQNCGKVPTNTIGLLRDIFCSTECNEFTTFMSNIYFNHKCKTRELDYMEYLTLAESEYRTFYRKGTWTASKTEPLSGFYVAPDENPHNDDESVGSRRRNRNRCNRGSVDP